MNKFQLIIITITKIYEFVSNIFSLIKSHHATEILKKEQSKIDDDIDDAVKNKDVDKLNDMLK